jgi:hypothetical protein
LLSYNLDCLAFGEGSVFGLLGVFFCLFWGFFLVGLGFELRASHLQRSRSMLQSLLLASACLVKGDKMDGHI